MGAGRGGLTEDVVLELHLNQWGRAGQAGKEKAGEGLPGLRKTRSKGRDPRNCKGSALISLAT